MERDVLAASIAALVARSPRYAGVVALYLFGSHGRGQARASSDIDLGVWLRDSPRTLDDLQLDLAADLERATGVAVDLVVLNVAPSDLVHRVLRDGILLLERDRSARVHFEVRARSDFFDMQPIRDEYRRAPRRTPA